MKAYQALAPLYDDAVGRPFFAALRLAFDTLAARHGLRFRDALDLGCGTGLFACHLARRYGARVLGIDNAPAMLEVARRRCHDCRVGFERMDLRDLDLPWRFDLVTANFDTLNHLRDPAELRRLLRRVATLLRPGGHLVFDLLTPAAAAHLPRGRRRWIRLAQGRVWQSVQPCGGGREIVTRVRVVEGVLPAGEQRQVERLYGVAEAAAGLGEAGLSLRAVLDATTLAPASFQPARALFLAQRSPQPAASAPIPVRGR